MNVIVLGRPAGSTVAIPGVRLSGAGRLLSDGSPVTVSVSVNGTILDVRASVGRLVRAGCFDNAVGVFALARVPTMALGSSSP